LNSLQKLLQEKGGVETISWQMFYTVKMDILHLLRIRIAIHSKFLQFAVNVMVKMRILYII
jgi:hypothetical protein